MYKRLLIVSVIIFSALAAFAILGFHSISLHADGLAGKRIVAFSEVAEQIRIDVKQKLDKFIETEQKRPYTDYQYFYAPETFNNGYNNDGNVILRSPLAKKMSHGMAYGHFQIEPDGKIVSPFYVEGQDEKLDSEKQLYISNLSDNVTNTLKGNPNGVSYLNMQKKALAKKAPAKSFSRLTGRSKQRTGKSEKPSSQKKHASKGKGKGQRQFAQNASANYEVNTFQEKLNQKLQIVTRSRNTLYYDQQSNKAKQVNENLSAQADQISQQGLNINASTNNQMQYGSDYQRGGRQNSGGYRGSTTPPANRTPAQLKPIISQDRRQGISVKDTEARTKAIAGDAKAIHAEKESQADPAPRPPRATPPKRRLSQAERFEYDNVAKDKDSYDKSLKSEEAKSDSNLKRESVTQNEGIMIGGHAGANAPTDQGNSSDSFKADIPKGSAIAGEKLDSANDPQPHIALEVTSPQTRPAEPQEDFLNLNGTGTEQSAAIPANASGIDGTQVPIDQSGAAYTYEQTLQSTLNNVLAAASDWQMRNEMVQIRIEPFVPITVDTAAKNGSYFGSQVFLLRHVQIEEDHFLQGFKLNENELINEVKESASRLVRGGMDFELSKNESPAAAHAAVLDFGFGRVVLNLMELKPQWIADQVSQLKTWYFAIVTIVLIATLVAMVSLWRSLKAQVKLARKKDDFISAVSHELRTPLTTIRMYTEMLEKNWIKTDDKRTEYYSTMRQESERLTRLIENVLDFSRIQRGKKRYNFALGDINSCVNEVVEMMTPCAANQNFRIETELGNNIKSTSFDNDAVMQIVINLIDNALKYAANAADKTIIVRTRTEGKYVLIEVADHGPGIPHTQRKKIFDEFYRIAEESKRETTGTGLGLALVKKFAQAHNGFVEAISAKPNGALLRVALASTTT